MKITDTKLSEQRLCFKDVLPGQFFRVYDGSLYLKAGKSPNNDFDTNLNLIIKFPECIVAYILNSDSVKTIYNDSEIILK